MRTFFVTLVGSAALLDMGLAAENSAATASVEAAQSIVALTADAAVVPAAWQPQIAPGSTATPASDARRRWMLLQGWSKVVVRDAAAAPEPAELPDAWARFRNYERAWYVARINLGESVPESLWLGFDAVAHQCVVFVNGEKIGEHIGGYTPFAFEITRSARPGINTIALFVRDEHAVEFADKQIAVSQLGVTHAGGFTSAAGIRGGVFLEARTPVHVDHVMIQTSTRKNELRVSTWLRGANSAAARVSHAVYAWPAGNQPMLALPAVRGAPGGGPLTIAVPWRDAQRWSPEHPNLYTLRTTVEADGRTETIETRFGFREFWAEGRNFILNGTPTRLLGTSVARDLGVAEAPEAGRRYAHDALAFLKREFNYRAMRLHASIHPRPAVEAADEVGVLLINQSGIWSAMGGFYQRGGDEFMRNMEREFAEWFWRDANNPSVVIWDVENEMIRDLRTPEREKWVLGLDKFIKQLDPTRIVEHSGAAWYAPAQETIHVHMQEQYAAVLREWQRDGRVPLVLGEFWAGGRGGETRLPNAYEFADRLDWLQEESRIYREKILEMRSYGASGVMPFWLDRTSLRRVNAGPRRTYDPSTDKIYEWPYPGLRNLGGEALAPVIAFAWPRGTSATEGVQVEREIIVCNDREQPAALTVTCEYAGRREQWQVNLAAGAQDRRKVSFAGATSGDLVVSVADASGRRLADDKLTLHAIARAALTPAPLTRRLVVVPKPDAATTRFLGELGLRFESGAEIPRDPQGTLLLVPPDAPRDALGRNGAALRQYLLAGGRALVLRQTEQPAWLPLALPFWPSSKKSAPEFTLLGWPATTRHLLFNRETALYATGHPAFAGLVAGDLAWWDVADGRVSDDAFVRPGALDLRTGAAYRVLAGGTRRENATLIEASFGEGTAIFCQLLVSTAPSPAPARAVALNLLRHLDGTGWPTSERQVAIAGNLTAAKLTALTALPAPAFVTAARGQALPRVVIAGDRADPALLETLATEGHTVLVLSREVANRLPGYAAATNNRSVIGTRARTVDEPLFWGIATGSFAPLEQTAAKGGLTKFPTAARVVLAGLSGPNFGGRNARPGNSGAERVEMMEADKPIATVEPRGRGQLVVTTLEPWNAASESQRQLLGTLLANAGVSLPAADLQPPFIAVKSTVPLELDGKLDDWTNDMEDRNVSRFQHAVPIVLSGRDVVTGTVANDAELSGVCYLLHDATNLYFGGIVFGGNASRVEFTIGRHAVSIDLTQRGLLVDGAAAPDGRVAVGRRPARDVSDTRLLSLTNFNAQIGSFSPGADKTGRTFEAAVPLNVFGFAPESQTATRIRLAGGDAMLETTLDVRLER